MRRSTSSALRGRDKGRHRTGDLQLFLRKPPHLSRPIDGFDWRYSQHDIVQHEDRRTATTHEDVHRGPPTSDEASKRGRGGPGGRADGESETAGRQNRPGGTADTEAGGEGRAATT